MKFFAYYLPQFHEIEENNQWWGMGFTEWLHVKNAKPLFKGHIQPKVPHEDKYYWLTDKDTVQWQTELLKKYNLDGFIYYHYYFKGKKLLEKPAENLLKWKDINQPFFFCWANHSWYKKEKEGNKLLIEQQYGNEDDWCRHFDYLLTFFKDKRYEKINNRPVFMIFFPFFKERDEIVEFFDKKCKENGFEGIYIIDTSFKEDDAISLLAKYKDKNYEKIVVRQPEYSRNTYHKDLVHRLEVYINKNVRKPRGLRRYKSNHLYKSYIKYQINNEKLINSICLSWDNTPRHKERGHIIYPPTKSEFFIFLDSLYNPSGYLFINAWNEWAEGMMLEPTEKDGFKYLEWIKEWQEINS